MVRDRMGRLAPIELRDGTFEKTGTGILSHLALLFVPAGVGVIQRLDVLAGTRCESWPRCLCRPCRAWLSPRRCSPSLRAASDEGRRLLPLGVSGADAAALAHRDHPAYCACDRVSAALRRHPLANPMLLSVALTGILVLGTHTHYAAYLDGAQFIHFLLGPATVALGIPLYQNRYLVLRSILPMACALLAGSLTALLSAVIIARLLGAPASVVTSIAPKSVTAAVAACVLG